jgi:hypothetical protein
MDQSDYAVKVMEGSCKGRFRGYLSMLEQLSHCWTNDLPLLKFDACEVTMALPLALTVIDWILGLTWMENAALV